eukprot:15457394-Alexandrium_andersonii.AAC.1
MAAQQCHSAPPLVQTPFAPRGPQDLRATTTMAVHAMSPCPFGHTSHCACSEHLPCRICSVPASPPAQRTLALSTEPLRCCTPRAYI